MPTLFTTPARQRWLHVLAAGALCWSVVPSHAAQPASAPARQFASWSGERWVTRSVTLDELGFTAPTILDNGNGQREFYLPVPANVPLADASIELKAHYLRADGGRTTVAVAIDGAPVAAHRYNDDQGDATQNVAVDAAARASGFIRFGISWLSVLSDQVCTDQRAPGNSLKIDPSTRLRYRYEKGAITTLAGAWGALPQRPTMLVGGRGLSAAAYDTAWRTGLAIERNGRHASVLVLPAVGGTVDLGTTEVPASLTTLPAFAAVAGHERRHKIADAAELGALLLLGENGPLHADVVITDAPLAAAMQGAFAALRAQVTALAPDAVAPYDALLQTNFSVQGGGADAPVRLAQFGGATAIAIPAGALAKAAALLGTQWRPAAQGTAITVGTAQTPKLDGDSILLSRLGGIAGSFDVLARTDRTVTFDLGGVATDGRLPDRIDLDVSAAPSINGEGPVVSVMVNDNLLGAQKLVADGTPQRLSAAIPRYVLAARNEVRIAFMRQPTQLRCHDTAMAYPVSILPDSTLHLGKTERRADFLGIAGQFADGATLLAPAAWLADPATSLPLVIRMADVAGLAPDKTDLQLVPAGQNGKPGSTFLALDVGVDGYQPGSVPRSSQLLLRTGGAKTQLDIRGVDSLATVAVVQAGGHDGIAFAAVGEHAPQMLAAFRIGHGNLAVLGNAGPVLELDTEAPDSNAGVRARWERSMTIWAVAGLLFVLLLIAARIATVRRQRRGKAPPP